MVFQMEPNRYFLPKSNEIRNKLTIMLPTIGCCLIFCMDTRFVHGHWPLQLKYVISSLPSPRRESNHATSKAVSCPPHTLLTFISYGDKSGKDLFLTNILVPAANFLVELWCFSIPIDFTLYVCTVLSFLYQHCQKYVCRTIEN